MRSSPVSSVLSHHDDECVTYPSFAPTVFICHHSKDLNSVQDMAKHFSTKSGMVAILVRQNANGSEKSKRLAITAPCSK